MATAIPVADNCGSVTPRNTILVLDEPLASLDQQSVRTMVALLGKLKRGSGLTLLWADHFLPALQEVAQDVLVIKGTGLIRHKADAVLGKTEGLSPFEKMNHE